MKAIFRRKVFLPGLGLAVAVVITTAAGAAQGPDKPKLKANRDTPSVMKDINDGKAKKIKEQKRTTAVWDGCKFHFLKSDHTEWEFDDGSVASVSENPEPLPPRSCSNPRNPTAAEMAEKDGRVNELNGGVAPPGAPPLPPPPADRYEGG